MWETVVPRKGDKLTLVGRMLPRLEGRFRAQILGFRWGGDAVGNLMTPMRDFPLLLSTTQFGARQYVNIVISVAVVSDRSIR